ncbi:hypothetical protein Tco_0538896, partial [Tanacetum coccineum]
KLASLNHFLAKSAERALPFFNTLKNITKGEQARVPMDPEGGGSVLADEETDHVTSVADTTFPGRDVVRIPIGI